MKSAQNQYYIGLDHLRAFAAYLVFCWHFLHGTNGSPISFEHYAALPLLSFIEEGHLGVSVFMVLSGYLFAKIINGKDINYFKFYLNRFLRLAPLMIFVVFINALIKYQNGDPAAWYFFASLANGLVFPYLPNAGWSITVEFHFYLLLPFLLYISRDSTYPLYFLLLLTISLRYGLYTINGDIQFLSYWTIIGRIDLFIIGIIGFKNSLLLKSAKSILIVSIVSLAAIYWCFDFNGGYKGTRGSLIWVCFSTLEGIFLISIIIFYDHYSVNFKSRLARLIANIGKYSYSMYLLHSFIVFYAASYIHNNILDISNFYTAILMATIVFIGFVPVTYLSYQFIELPFLKIRMNYRKKITSD